MEKRQRIDTLIDALVWLRRKARRVARIGGMDDEYEQQVAEDERRHGAFYEQLAGRYLHCTKCSALPLILAAGEVSPNRGQFEFTYPQTARSFAFRNGHIAIFDFLSPSRAEAIQHFWKLGSFFYWRPATVMLDLDPIWVESHILRARDVPIQPYDVMLIPAVEAWITAPIPLAAITKVTFLVAGKAYAEFTNPWDVEVLGATRIELEKRHAMSKDIDPLVRALAKSSGHGG